MKKTQQHNLDSKGRRQPNTARTKEQWLAAIKHDKKSFVSGQPYDYSLIKTAHVRSTDRIKFTCPDHGTFEVTAHSHLLFGCRVCGPLRTGKKKQGQPSHRKMTVEQAIARAEELWPDYDFSRVTKYTNNQEVWEIGCVKHGIWYKNRAVNVLWHGGIGCVECKRDSHKRGGRLGSVSRRDAFMAMVKHHGYKVVSKFTRAHDPIKLQCPDHGIFTAPKAYYVTQGFTCRQCRKGGSTQEKILQRRLVDSGRLGPVELHRRDLLPHTLELDFYLPRHKVAIEVNGVYFHNAMVKDPGYHKNKTEEAEKLGIQLLHFTDIDISSKTSLVVSMIHAKCGIFKHRLGGRQTTVAKILYKEAAEFLDENHIQGRIAGSTYLGLYTHLNGKDILVSVAVFGKSRFSKDHDWELLRFATKRTCQVVGGLEKLVATFSKQHKGESIVSYADRYYSQGGVYESTGWTYVRATKPSYSWHDSRGNILSRFQTQKPNLVNILENYDPELSQSENMRMHGFWQLWNCGNYVYERIL